MERREFLSMTVIGLPAIGSVLMTDRGSSVQDKPLKMTDDLVKEFVSAGHNDLPAVQRMLKEHPGLLNASWDLGGGDFETALEGAGHVGDRQIAEFLIGQGARPNIFVLAMLGHTEIIRSLLVSFPALLFAKGPHGLSLLHHAERGGVQELVDHLTVLGLTQKKFQMP